ncbi:MAG: S8 family serine peptidase, partial [Pseudomonadales bacterium]
IEVTVTDNDGATATASVNVTVRDVPNLPPTVSLSADQTVDEGDAVSISVSVADSDGSIALVEGTQTSGPAVIDGLVSATNVTFTAPEVDSDSVVTIEVTVTDNDGATATASVNVTVRDISVPNLPPTIDLGPDLIIDEGEAVSVVVTAADADGTITIGGSQTAGPDIIDGTISPQFLRFTAPLVDQEETITISVTVTDDDGATATDTINFTVRNLAETFQLSGEIFPADQNQVDVDVNDASRQYIDDPNTVFESNNEAVEAQALGNPVILNGFVSKVPTGPIDGATGNFENNADPDDFFSVHLLAGQFVSLRSADFDPSDPQSIDFDLMVYDTNLDLVVQSIAPDASVESVAVPTEGDYIVRVNAFTGIGKYILNIGSTSFATGLKAYGESADFIPGQAVVKRRAKRQAAYGKPALENLNLSHGDVSRAGLLRFSYRKRVASSGAKQSLMARIRNRNMAKHDSLARIKSLRQREDIEFVEPNYRVHAFASPNDSFYGLQAHYTQIQLPQAWDITTGTPASGNVIVAVVDTGVVLQHEDLASKLVSGYDFIRDTDISADGNGIDSDPSDPGDGGSQSPSSWHGTHVSGTVGAATNNGIGVAGVSWGARIMPVRVLGVGGGSSYDVLQGVRYAAGLSNDSGTVPAQAADIINLSLGGGGFSQSSQNTYDEVYDAGVLVVAAAGNESTSVPSYPASYDGVISVSAVDLLDGLAPYSNFGSTVDVAAPGGDMSVDSNGDSYGDGVLSTLVDDVGGSLQPTYQFYQGTSMAAPHVAGVAALMKAVYPAMTAADFTAGLVNGEITRDIGSAGRDNSYGYGLINALAAVQYATSLAGGEVAGAISIEPGRLDFGRALVSRSLSLTSIGNNPPSVSSAASSESWLAVETNAVDGDGIGSYNVTVNRAGLADSTYSGAITFVLSDAAEWAIPVSMTVQTGSAAGGDAGFQYVLLLDADTEEPVDQQNVDLVSGRYTYNFTDIPAGEYLVLTGSDVDNNLFICELGESCGGYPTLEQSVRVNVDQNITGLDFLVSIIADVVESASDANTGSRQGVRLIKKEEPADD